DAADDERKKQQSGPHLAHAFHSLAPGGAHTGRQVAGSGVADHGDGQHVHGDGENTGQDAGDEQLADVLFGDQAVDGEYRGGGNHDAERTASGDDAGGKALRVAVAAHFRIG